MKNLPVAFFVALTVSALALPAFAHQDPAQANDDDIMKKEYTFYKDIKPIIKSRCQSCHSGEYPAADKDLSKVEAFKANEEKDDKAYFIKKGNPDKSILVWVLEKSHDKPQMPPRKKLDEKTVKIVKAWIKQGAKLGKAPEDGN